MYVLKKGTSKENVHGTWWADGDSVTIKCPECGLIGLLDHDVQPNGDVTPSLDCPRESCSFHTMVTLEGWYTTAPNHPFGGDGETP